MKFSTEDVLLDESLSASKDNRAELEKLLNHYSQDSLKLEAAKFLIKNMPGHYSYQDSQLMERYYAQVEAFLMRHKGAKSDILRDSINQFARDLQLKQCNKIFDIEIITSDFLISNIDEAFDCWMNLPWARHLSFDEFCEYILPYKVQELQPFDDWRTEFRTFCDSGLSQLEYCEMHKESTYNASIILSSNLIDSIKPYLSWSLDYPILKVSTKRKMPFGKCDDYADLMTSIFRAHGIPIVLDYTPQWAYRDLGHTWTSILAQTGKNIPFSAFFTSPREAHKIDERLAKVFRHTYALNQDLKRLNEIEKYVPFTFMNIFQKDVTDEYIKCKKIELSDKSWEDGYVYLGVSDGEKWSPIHFTYCEDGKASFDKMGLNSVYILMKYQHNGKIEYLSNPFILNYDGSLHYFIPDNSICIGAKLYRKFPVLEYASKYSTRLIGGRFEASNNPNFDNAKTIHVIESGAAIAREVAIADSIQPYRYWRYIQSTPDTYCSIGEIIFYIDNKPVYGDIIGTNGCKHPEYGRYKENVFDRNWLTAFDAPISKDAWVGMDFKTPVSINKIVYVGRGDGNCIEIGDVYELYYWINGRWKSLGKKKAQSVYVEFFNIPSNSLLLLRDLTKGSNERIFTIDKSLNQTWH
ncbi:MAG: hypothetical protein K2I48_05880 [Muribaculaceae bacterium]|nr:hypothetical protein [Muribaculaceae bacterium]